MATRQPVFDPHDQATLRSLAAKANRHQAWDDLCTLLAQPRMEKCAELWLPFMEQLLHNWPDEIRVWPTAWLSKRNAPKATALVRHFYFGGRTESQLSKALLHLAALSQESMPRLTHFTIAVYFSDTAARRVTNADRLSVDEARMLVDRMSLPSMRHVRVEGSGLPRLLWDALNGAAWELETLRIKGSKRDSDMALLFEAPRVQVGRVILGDLLGHVEFGEASVNALISQHARTLRSFTATEAIADAPSLQLLSEATWPALESLSLERQRTELCPVLPRWLANAPKLRALEVSIGSLSWNYWRDGTAIPTVPDSPEGVLKMLQHHPLPPLESLTLDVALGGRLAEALRANFAPGGQQSLAIKHLTLVRREADGDVARAIGHLCLETLSVRDAQASFWHGMQQADFSQLRCLAVGSSSEQTTDEERLLPFALIHVNAPALCALQLDYSVVTDAVLDAIERAPYYAQLRSLYKDGKPNFLWNESLEARFLAMCETVANRTAPLQERTKTS